MISKDIFGNEIRPGQTVVFMPKGSRAYARLTSGEVLGFTKKHVRVQSDSNKEFYKKMKSGMVLEQERADGYPPHELVSEENVAIWPFQKGADIRDML